MFPLRSELAMTFTDAIPRTVTYRATKLAPKLAPKLAGERFAPCLPSPAREREGSGRHHTDLVPWRQHFQRVVQS
jgi:hypothetical protein